MPRPDLMSALRVTITVAVAVQPAVSSNRAKLGLMLPHTALLVLGRLAFGNEVSNAFKEGCPILDTSLEGP